MILKSAEISPDGKYRYTLLRVWNSKRPLLMFVMLNPSTADADLDDATIRRCMGFADRWQYGGMIVVNLYALRATHPDDLWRSHDPVGPENEKHIALWALRPARVVCAWGNEAHRDRADHVSRLLLKLREGAFQPNNLYCLGKTNSGAPKHPVRLAYVTELEVYR